MTEWKVKLSLSVVTVNKREKENGLWIRTTDEERYKEDKKGERRRMQEMGESSNNVATCSLPPITSFQFSWISNHM